MSRERDEERMGEDAFNDPGGSGGFEDAGGESGGAAGGEQSAAESGDAGASRTTGSAADFDPGQYSGGGGELY